MAQGNPGRRVYDTKTSGIIYDKDHAAGLNNSLYARGTISLPSYAKQQLQFEADFLFDSGCQVDLMMPLRKARQLGLGAISHGTMRGIEDKGTPVVGWEPVLVAFTFYDPDDGAEVGQRVSPLQTYSRYSPGDSFAPLPPAAETITPAEDPLLHTFAGLRDPSTPRSTAPAGSRLDISPIEKKTKGLPDCIIGAPGMARLNIQADFKNHYIFVASLEDVIVV
ncbi:hypothetical protein WJX73_008733 [Symbiochloris irregularis]|uniref:Peptidase A1 domain-containing protein n=1 Tax=Symbiochloris irregularis TaxID=706552 RepID=A0AAW1NN97_9CHLO